MLDVTRATALGVLTAMNGTLLCVHRQGDRQCDHGQRRVTPPPTHGRFLVKRVSRPEVVESVVFLVARAPHARWINASGAIQVQSEARRVLA